jgi:hypothetical protein
MKKISRKIQIIFDTEKWLWKSDLGTFWQPMWTSVKVKSKNIFLLLIFLQKWSPCWLTSAKLHHWGHTIIHGWLQGLCPRLTFKKLLKIWWIWGVRSWPQEFVDKEGVNTYNVADPS